MRRRMRPLHSLQQLRFQFRAVFLQVEWRLIEPQPQALLVWPVELRNGRLNFCELGHAENVVGAQVRTTEKSSVPSASGRTPKHRVNLTTAR